MEETMMVGLRLTQEGVSSKAFFLRFNRHIESVFGREIDRLCSLGLLEWVDQNGERVRLTLRGRLLGNQVFMQFVGCQ
jgi:oxygen-independent coproporphyrinogen-3 oxidase